MHTIYELFFDPAYEYGRLILLILIMNWVYSALYMSVRSRPFKPGNQLAFLLTGFALFVITPGTCFTPETKPIGLAAILGIGLGITLGIALGLQRKKLP